MPSPTFAHSSANLGLLFFKIGLKFSELGLSSLKCSLLPQQVSPLTLDGRPFKVSSGAVSRRVPLAW
jgi:hypothetical protein